MGRLLQRARLPWAQKATVPDPLTVPMVLAPGRQTGEAQKKGPPMPQEPPPDSQRYRSYPRKHPRLLKKTLFYLKNGAERGRETRAAAVIWWTSTREGENQAEAGCVPLPAHTRARVTNEAIVPLQETCERL